jgi:hypothetical protein
MITLPPTSPSIDECLKDPRNFWPFAWLRFLARLPFKRSTFLAPWHTVEGMVDPGWAERPSPFVAALLLAPRRLDSSVRTFPRRGSPETTVVLPVAPIFEEERNHAVEHGVVSLLERFQERGIDPELVDVNRAPVV